MARPLDDSARYWDGHARHDPLWAILSDPARKGRRWDVERFFQTGVGEISLLFYRLRTHGLEVRRERALDFGCGVGRLSQALAAHMAEVVGVDVSPGMIRLAEQLNRRPDRVRYVANPADDLTVLGDTRFDLAYSAIVLQHIEPATAEGYLRELTRVLVPGGLLVFQLPSHRRGPDDGPPPPALRLMPDEAYAASLGVAHPPRTVAPVSRLTIEVDVTNASQFPWRLDEYGSMSVGNHWLDEAGNVLVRDDGRAAMGLSLAPGEWCRVAVPIVAPAAEGAYLLGFDLAHEGVTWFEHKGSTPLLLPVRVAADAVGEVADPATRAPSPATAAASPEERGSLPLDAMEDVEAPPDFPMHGIRRDIVERLISDAGADVLVVDDDRSCGDDWISHWYVVRKR